MPPKSKKKPKSIKNRENTAIHMDAIIEIVNARITFPTCKMDDSQIILRGCVAITSCKGSISGYSKSHVGLPSHTTCLKTLSQLSMNEMIQQSTYMLRDAGKNVIHKGQAYRFAIDKTQDPYYGKHDTAPDSYIVGGKSKDSTNYFFTYLTMSIMDQGRHLTLFSIPWQKGMKDIEAIQQCVKLIRDIGLKIRCLCLDREFYVGEIFQYLQNERIPHIVPVPKKGAKLKQNLSGKASKTFKYTLNEESKNPVELVITDCVVYLKGKKGKRGMKHHAFVVFGVSASPRYIREVYRHRFAIESTYRIRNIPRPKTTSKKPNIRYFYSLIASLIQNYWVSIKWNHFSSIQRGPKVVKNDLFPLAHLLELIYAEASICFSLKDIDDIKIT